MVYGLPTAGEPNWDVKLNASVEAVKATADAAQPAASLEAAVAGKIGTAGALDSALSASTDARIDALAVTKNGVAMATWFQALLAGTARHVGVGDSTMEGSGRSDEADRWMNLISNDLRATLGVAGDDYIPAFSSTSVPDLWTRSAGAVEGGTTAAAAGLGSKALTLPAGEYAEVTFTGTSFRVHYYAGGATGTLQISVDGGAAVEVPTNTGLGSQIYTVSGLSEASHTIRVTAKAAGAACYLQGGTPDYGSGIQYYDAAHAGITAQTVAENTQCLDQLSNVLPHLVTVDLGINDYRGNRTPAQYRANIETILAKIKAECACSILLVVPHEPYHAGTPVAPWTDYVDVIRDIAANDVGVALLDIYALGDDLAWDNDPNGYLSDEGAVGPSGNLHLSDAGEDFYRDQFLTYFGAGQSPQSLASIASVGPTASAYLLALANTWAAAQTFSSTVSVAGTLTALGLVDLRGTSAQVWLGNNRKIRANKADGTLADMIYRATNDRVIVGDSGTGTVITGSALGFFGGVPASKPTLNYSRSAAGETTAGAAIRSALANLGLVTDSTTA